MVFIKNIFRKFQFTAKLLETYFLSKKYLTPKGWYLSRFLSTPVDANSLPLPWFTYASIHFIKEKLVNKSLLVFEFGSGNSTQWFATRVKHIVSVEHDSNFYNKRKQDISLLKNVDYNLIPLNNGYSDKILDFNDVFDIVIIDGRDRIECAKKCLKALKKDGIVIWDNSDRDEYNEGYNFLSKNNFKKIDFRGIGPISHKEWQTSIFYRNNNCLDI